MSSLRDAGFGEPGRERARLSGYFVVAIVVTPEAVVIDDEFLRMPLEVVKEIEQGVAAPSTFIMVR